VQADPASPTVLLPSEAGDIVVRQRHYYNRHLTKRLANPLLDAKQLVLFRHIPVSDSRMLAEALAGVRESFSKHNLARVYAALDPGRE
jgi:polyphosphate kinase 2 (PPK2 family)